MFIVNTKILGFIIKLQLFFKWYLICFPDNVDYSTEDFYQKEEKIIFYVFLSR